MRRAALVLVPALALAAYLLRSAKPESGAAEAAVAPSTEAPSAGKRAAVAPAPPTATPAASEVALYGERAAVSAPGRASASASTAPQPPPVEGTPAVALPAAGVRAIPGPPSPSGPASSCGGLFVRLITRADDQKFSFASIAKGYTQPAKIVHVGESVGGFRVTGIEWDRVWVQSGGTRCAVGMHFGARDAAEEANEGITAEEYARLPWVLPQSIVSGLSKRAEMEFELDDQTIADLYARGADVFAGLRIQVVEAKADAPGGLSLHEIRLDSLLERLGIEPGDLLVSIDDQPTSSVDDVVAALDAARDAESLTVRWMRDGEPFTLKLRARE